MGVSDTVQKLHEKNRFVANERFGLVKEYFRNRTAVLEVGSSTGAFLELLGNHLKVAVEPSDKSRYLCRKYAKEVYADISEVLDVESADKRFFSYEVSSIDDVTEFNFERPIVTSLMKSASLSERLKELGVANNKVCSINSR